MKNMFVKEYRIVMPDDGASYFQCELSTDKTIDIDMGELYEFTILTDKELELHSLSCVEWEELTEELLEKKYEFKNILNQYLQQFTEKEIDEINKASDFMDDEWEDEDEW